MRKSTVTATWLWGLGAILAGLIAAGVGTGLIFAAGGTYGGFTGNEFIPNYDAFFWGMVTLASVGAFVALVGAVVQLVAWIGALLNTFAAADKTWFVVVLVGGLIGFLGFLVGPFAVMVAYLIAGPDSYRAEARPPAVGQPPYPLAPTT